jgi:glycosyltransferase involved in cell wall biosynthesis
MSSIKSVNPPLVSILMTVYNREVFIVEAIESVLANNYANWELIITDDCSTDHSFDIAKSYANKDHRIILFRNEKNLGDYPNRNKAASYAQGAYIVIVDSDDRMYPDSLEKWVSFIQDSGCKFGIFNHTGAIESFVLDSPTIIQRHFFEKPILNFGPVATIIENNYFKSIDGFPIKYGPANDMYYNLKAALGTSVAVFPIPLVDYRIHDGQEMNNKYSYLSNNYLYLRDALTELNLPLTKQQIEFIYKKNKRRFLVNLLKFFFKTFDFKRAIKAVRMTNFRIQDIFIAVFQK